MTHSKKAVLSFLQKIIFLGLMTVIVQLVSPFSFAQLSGQPNFPRCGESDTDLKRSLDDNYCPRLEGVHLKDCCPPVLGQKLTCYYGVTMDSTEPIYYNANYFTCNGTTTVAHSCCSTGVRSCYRNLIVKDFIPRLIQRSDKQKSCCFESCPPAEYWRSAPNADTRFTAQHKLVSPSSVCGVGQTNTCTVSGACQASTYCPTPPSPPNPPSPNPLPPTPLPPSPPTPNPPNPPNPPTPLPPGGNPGNG